MDSVKVRALVCRAVDYKDSDRLVTLVTAEEGKLSAILKGCRKQGSKLRFCSAPFCFGEYILAQKNGFYVITACTPVEQFAAMSENLDKYYAGSVILESIDRITEDGMQLAPVLVLALNYLKILCYEELEESVVLVAFLMELYRIAGYGLNFEACRICRLADMRKKYFSPSEGGVLCSSCAKYDSEQLSPGAYALFKAVEEKIPLNVLRFTLSAQRECLRILGDYFEYFAKERLNSLKQYLDISKSVEKPL